MLGFVCSLAKTQAFGEDRLADLIIFFHSVLLLAQTYLKYRFLLSDRTCNVTFHGPHCFLSCSLSGLYFHAKYYWTGHWMCLTLDLPCFILFLARRGKNEQLPVRDLTIFLRENCSCAETTYHLWKIKISKAVSPCCHNMVQVRSLLLGQRSQALWWNRKIAFASK